MTDDLAAVLGGPHRPCARLVSLGSDGVARASWEGDGAILEDGSATYDRTRAVRRSGSATLANPTGSLSPQRPGDYLFTGERIRLERGAIIGQSRVYGTLITGVVTGFQAEMSGHLSITVEDPMSLLAQPFGVVVSIEAGTSAADALVTLWGPVLGDASDWTLDDAGRACPLRVFMEDDDRLSAVTAFLADMGLEAFADRSGQVVLQPIPDPSTQTAATAVRGFLPGDDATLLDLVRSGDSRPYNRVVVVIETTDGAPTIRSEVSVTDASSPIHPDRIGIQTAPIHRLTGGGLADANAAGRALLIQYSLFTDAVSGTAIPDQGIEAGDVVTLAESVSGATDLYVVDSVQHPVVTGSMSIAATRVVPLFATVDG
jgi:hypothetical protein